MNAWFLMAQGENERMNGIHNIANITKENVCRISVLSLLCTLLNFFHLHSFKDQINHSTLILKVLKFF